MCVECVCVYSIAYMLLPPFICSSYDTYVRIRTRIYCFGLLTTSLLSCFSCFLRRIDGTRDLLPSATACLHQALLLIQSQPLRRHARRCVMCLFFSFDSITEYLSN